LIRPRFISGSLNSHSNWFGNRRLEAERFRHSCLRPSPPHQRLKQRDDLVVGQVERRVARHEFGLLIPRQLGRARRRIPPPTPTREGRRTWK
jgi:hypothetical protein